MRTVMLHMSYSGWPLNRVLSELLRDLLREDWARHSDDSHNEHYYVVGQDAFKKGCDGELEFAHVMFGSAQSGTGRVLPTKAAKAIEHYVALKDTGYLLREFFKYVLKDKYALTDQEILRIVGSRQGLQTTRNVEKVKEDPTFVAADVAKYIAELVDDRDLERYYAKEVIALLPELVERADELKAEVLPLAPHSGVLRCLEEATRCYLYGFFRASITTCRTALEEALEDRVGWKVPERGPNQSRIRKLINKAIEDGFLDRKLWKSVAHDMVTEASEIIHGTVAEEKKTTLQNVARHMLDTTRVMIRVLYSGKSR